MIKKHSDNEGIRASYLNIMAGHPSFELQGRMSQIGLQKINKQSEKVSKNGGKEESAKNDLAELEFDEGNFNNNNN